MMNERLNHTNAYVGENVTKSVLHNPTTHSMKNMKVVVLNKSELSDLSAGAALVTLKRNLENRGELIVHSKDEGQHPIFTRSDIEVNIENNIDERIHCKRNLKEDNSQTSDGEGSSDGCRLLNSQHNRVCSKFDSRSASRALKDFTECKGIERNPSRQNKELYYVREVYKTNCNSRNHDSVDRQTICSRTSASEESGGRERHLEERSSNLRCEKNQYEDHKNNKHRHNKHFEKYFFEKLNCKQRYSEKEKSPRRLHSINRCTEKCCVPPHGSRSYSSNAQKRSRSPTTYFGNGSRSFYSRRSPRKAKREHSNSTAAKDYEKQSRHDYSSSRCNRSSGSRKHNQAHGVASTQTKSHLNLYSKLRGSSSSSKIRKHSQYEKERVSPQALQDYVYLLPYYFGYYQADEFWIPASLSWPYFISAPYMTTPGSFYNFESDHEYYASSRPRSRSEPIINASSSPTNQFASSDWEEPTSTTL